MRNNPIIGKTILITGGTGSFGETMMKKLLVLSPKEIIIFSRDELKQFEMRNNYKSPLLSFIIGDVRDMDSVNRAMKGVNYVFHAAALKQVPTGEFFPLEAIKTNVIGGYNVITSAMENNVDKVVVLSTDKAVYAINAMGMTKGLMEKIMIASSNEVNRLGLKTTLCGVRYGNVMYSRGSVIPYFISLIKKNKKLKVTNSNMTRFLLPLRDAIELVIYVLSNGASGNIYVKKAPATDMGTLARAISTIFHYGKDFETIGVRAGEKIHETLISKEEWMRVKDEGDFYAIPPEASGLDYETYFAKGKKTSKDEDGYTSFNTKQLSLQETIDLLLTLPEIKEELRKWKKS